jgi:hypothetical protein
MQTDILLKQLYTSLADLKTAIDKFEKHSPPSTDYAEQLHSAIHNSNKLVSAYLVLKEQKDVSPELNLHVKLMNVPTPEEKSAIIEPIRESVIVETPEAIVKEEVKSIEVIKEPVAETENSVVPIIEVKTVTKELPKIAININDKFRFINELFASNSNEYHIAIEQINVVRSLEELNNYLKGLKSIYNWNDDNEVVKNLYSLAQKRFL